MGPVPIAIPGDLQKKFITVTPTDRRHGNACAHAKICVHSVLNDDRAAVGEIHFASSRLENVSNHNFQHIEFYYFLTT